MKKLDNFKNSLNILKGVNYEIADNDEIYRAGIIGQFNLTFELAWKLLQKILTESGVSAADTGSPREILKLGYKYGFINNEDVWLNIIKDRNVSIHIYNEEFILHIINRIRDIYTLEFESFCILMEEKIKDI